MAMGAHAAPLVRPPTPTLTLTLPLLLLVLLCSDAVIVSFGDQDASSQALLKFKSSLSDGDGGAALANWNTSSTNPCSGAGMSWTGVICSEGNVWGLQLENLSLSGEIDVDSLVALPQLRTLSFMNNKFKGPMPEFRKLGALKSLYLSNNQFSEDIPDDAFLGMTSLKKVYMANNQFSGTIPTSLAASPRLLELRLENNQFVGPIPDFSPNLKLLNVSNNQLDGPIPTSLINMDATSFSGNKDLCGKPLDSICNSSSPPPAADPIDTPTPPHTKEKPSLLRIVVMVIAGLVALAALVLLLILVYRSIRSSQTPRLGRASTSSYNKNKVTPSSQGNRSVEHVSEMSGPGSGPSRKQADQHGKLSFVRDDRERFELQDLLRASAEVLGSGSFGSSYKAVLMDGQAVVVKRFKQMNSVGREEFHEHMRRLGRLRHPNLLPLVAYYYRKEEKLLVFDYMHNGSLASQLHGNHSVDKPGLDWPTRLKIIKGVAKGLAYLYSELPSLIVPHGHLKSSNVVLDNSFEPLLMDYTLVPVVNAEAAHQLMVAYKSPEYAQHDRPSKKTDVWSLGILILETLTGKFPANYLAQGADLASWVNSIIGEEIGTQVFDKEMGSTNNAQGEMHKLLRIGMGCCEEDLETRLDLKEAVERIELLKERDAP